MTVTLPWAGGYKNPGSGSGVQQRRQSAEKDGNLVRKAHRGEKWRVVS